MAKQVSWAKGLSSILFWSIISAAFIGPGTVTTAAKAGASFQIGLLWALFFSVLATVVLQEAAARITIASGKNLGQIVALKFGRGKGLRWFLFLAVAFGCAAYQAGNLLGAISGLLLFDAIGKNLGILLLGILCFTLLLIGSYRTIARVLGVVVALMGTIFIYVSTFSDYGIMDMVAGIVRPAIPAGGGILVIGLIGTTIVPYNLFLASGISKGQSINEMRIGLILAILIGGVISMAILLVGTQVEGDFSFASLTAALSLRLGTWAKILFGLGLFAAGMSSAITAPLAAAVTAQSLIGKAEKDWSNQGKYFRYVWGAVLGIGLIFGLSGIQAVPAIILAQALNGALLPIVAIFLFLAANDSELLGADFTNRWLSNVLTLGIVGLSCFLGLNNLVKAIGRAFSFSPKGYFGLIVLISLTIVILLFYKVYLKKR